MFPREEAGDAAGRRIEIGIILHRPDDKLILTANISASRPIWRNTLADKLNRHSKRGSKPEALGVDRFAGGEVLNEFHQLFFVQIGDRPK